jgi:hypothetical protein
MPLETTAPRLGPGELAHARLAQVQVAGYFGESKEYSRSFFLLGGPVGLAVTGAASLAHNASKKAEAERAAIPRWHQLGTAEILVTNQRLTATASGQSGSFWYADTGPMQMAGGLHGAPAVQFQTAGQPPFQLESPWAPLLYVFVHYLVDGRAPGVPVPVGLLERAKAQGRLR